MKRHDPLRRAAVILAVCIVAVMVDFIVMMTVKPYQNSRIGSPVMMIIFFGLLILVLVAIVRLVDTKRQIDRAQGVHRA